MELAKITHAQRNDTELSWAQNQKALSQKSNCSEESL